MFLVPFDTSEDINEIFKIETILNTVVKIEPLRNQNFYHNAKDVNDLVTLLIIVERVHTVWNLLHVIPQKIVINQH